MAVNKILDFPKPQTKKEVQQYIGLINKILHWTNKMQASCPNLRSLAGNKSGWGSTPTRQEECGPAAWAIRIQITRKREMGEKLTTT